MPRATWKGSIMLGLLNVPIATYVANREEKVSFNTVEIETGERIKMPYVSSVTGAELDRKTDVMKRYDFGDGRSADVTADDLATVHPAKSKVIQLQGFVPRVSIDPSLYATTHQVGALPETGQALSLLSIAMQSRDLVGVGTYVKGNAEKLVLLRANGARVWLHELYWADEVREPVEPLSGQTDKRMLAMAEQLVDGLVMDWDHGSYVNTHRDAMLAMLELKATGAEIEAAVEPDMPSPSDLMAQLEASIAAAKAVKA